jgi:hypothetical protein
MVMSPPANVNKHYFTYTLSKFYRAVKAVMAVGPGWDKSDATTPTISGPGDSEIDRWVTGPLGTSMRR